VISHLIDVLFKPNELLLLPGGLQQSEKVVKALNEATDPLTLSLFNAFTQKSNWLIKRADFCIIIVDF